MKISIVDDIERERNELLCCLREWSEERGTDTLIAEFQSGDDFLKKSSSDAPDIVFMDIYIGDENGFDIASQLRKISALCVTIFITSSSDDALKAFSLHPFDYVVKPWKKETIFRVMDEAATLCENCEKYIELKVGRQITRLRVSQICYGVSDDHHVNIVTCSGETIKSYSTFAEISAELTRDSRFIVCNRGIVVNMDHISGCAGKSFVMKNGDSLPLKIKDIPALKKAFAEYIFAGTKRW